MKNQSVIGISFTEDKSKVLLTKRRDVPVWVLPGGGVEKNESFENAIKREFFEETGYRALVIRKVGEYTPINKLSKFTHLYEMKIISGTPRTSSETKEISFFSLDMLPKLIPPPYREWINDASLNKSKLIQKKLYSVNYLTLLKNLFLHPILVLRFLLTKIGLTINT